MIRLADAPLGTPHAKAQCCWCAGPLVVNQVEQLRCWTCVQRACLDRQLACATFVTYGAVQARDLGLPKAGVYCWHLPLPSQVPIYEAARRGGYLLWGGRAGPGKSTGARNWLYYRSLNVPGHEALLLRENWDQLQGNHTIKMAVEVPLLGGRWYETDRRAVFGKGSDQSIIFCGHMAEADAVTRYLGLEYGAIVADEASLYPLDPYGAPVLAELSTRARRDYVDRAGQEVKGIFLPVTNPGGPSAQWLREMHIDHRPDFDLFPALRPEYDAAGVQISGYQAEQWVYAPASLRDNPYLRETYAQTDLAVLSGTRYKQLAEGDWYAFAGMFFPMWDAKVHVKRASWAA